MKQQKTIAKTQSIPKETLFSKLSSNKKILFFSLSILLVFALMLSLFLTIHVAKRCVSYEGMTISKDVYAYMQANFRYSYLVKYASKGAQDTEEFWKKEKDSTTHLTWGEDLEQETKLYIGRTLAAATLFDEAGYTLSDSNYETIEKIATSLLDNRFQNSKKNYNKEAKGMGFSFSSMKKALLFEMKATLLLTYANTTDESALKSYYEDAYRRIGIVYIPKSSASYEDTVLFLEGALEQEVSQSDFISWVNDTTLNKNPGYASYPNGYYFSQESNYTSSYATYLPLVVGSAFSLDLGESEKIEVKNENLGLDGTYFIMRLDLEESAFTNSSSEMFSDFQKNANSYYVSEWLDECYLSVTFYDRHIPILPPQGKNNNLYVFFG